MKPWLRLRRSTAPYLALLLAAISIACDGGAEDSGTRPGDDVITKQSALTTNKMSYYIPAYFFTGDTTAWDNFLNSLPYDLLGAITVVVTGEHSEPPKADVEDVNLVNHIAALHAKNIRVIGYVYWKPKTHACDPTPPANEDCSPDRVYTSLPDTCTGTCIGNYVVDMVNQWYRPTQWSYALDGIWFDESERDDVSDLKDAQRLASTVAARGAYYGVPQRVFNWGTPGSSLMTFVDCGLVGAAQSVGMHWSNLEDTASIVKDYPATAFSWAQSYKAGHFVQLAHSYDLGQGVTPVHDIFASIRARFAAGAFVTNQPNWDSPADDALWNEEATEYGTNFSFDNSGTDASQCFSFNGICAGPSTCQVCDCPRNLALGKTATQSSTVIGGVASRAVDGNTSGNWNDNSVTHTDFEANPWWMVDLGTVGSNQYHQVDTIDIYNRTDCCADRLTNFTVTTSTDGTLWNHSFNVSGEAGVPTSIWVAPRFSSIRYIKIQLNGTNNLSLAEVNVWGRS